MQGLVALFQDSAFSGSCWCIFGVFGNSKCRRLLAIGGLTHFAARLRHPHLGEHFCPTFPPASMEIASSYCKVCLR